MKEILTFTNYEQPDMYKKVASLVEIMRDGGYKTFWIDNQGGNRGLYAIDIYTPTSYRTIAIYISDHGEEAFDTEYYYTRSFEKISTAMCDIPFILWRNDACREANPLVIETNRQYCTDDIIHSWMTLAGVRYKLYDPKRDIFSKEFTPKERYVQGKRYKEIE